MKTHLYIIELSDNDIRVIAQGLHILAINEPTHETSVDALTQLIRQTSSINRNAATFNVFRRLQAPSEALNLDRVSYIPL